MERIPFDEPTDVVGISVETYTAKRAYQIASEYRRRGVPVIMGGFQATLCPQEVAQYADAVIVGEAEEVWSQVLVDAERGTLQTFYRASGRPAWGICAQTVPSFRESTIFPSVWWRRVVAVTSSVIFVPCKRSSTTDRRAGQPTIFLRMEKSARQASLLFCGR